MYHGVLQQHPFFLFYSFFLTLSLSIYSFFLFDLMFAVALSLEIYLSRSLLGFVFFSLSLSLFLSFVLSIYTCMYQLYPNGVFER